VVLSGGSPLVVGSSQFSLSANTSVPTGAANPQSPPSSRILDSQGQDITAQIAGGNLGGPSGTFHNRVLASLLGDATQAGSLNTFANSLADTVTGFCSREPSRPRPGRLNGLPLFTYNNADATTAAASFSLNAAITPICWPPWMPAATPTEMRCNWPLWPLPPQRRRQRPDLRSLFRRNHLRRRQRKRPLATSNQQAQQQVTDQTKALRDQISGVSLDQQAHPDDTVSEELSGGCKLVTVLDAMTQTTLNMLP